MFDKKGIPDGISDFKTLIENNYYYIDKTNFIEDIGKNIGKALLFTRPRRFGKTLSMSMLKYFFDIKSSSENRKLFQGLAIEKTSYISEQGKNPVIFISFKDVKFNTFEKVLEQVKILISQLYRENIDLLDMINPLDREMFVKYYKRDVNEVELKNSLLFLSQLLFEKYDKKVVILIDEYDTPLVSAYQYEYYDDALNFFKGLYSLTLKDNQQVHLGVMTGIIRINKAGIFSDLNNLQINSILEDEYADCFGLSEKEVIEMLAYYNMEKEITEIKRWYDGYRFGNKELYNPWSILKFISRKELKAYWIDTSENYLIKEILKNADSTLFENLEKLFSGEVIEETITGNSSMSSLLTQQEIWELMLFSGYLTIDKKIDGNIYKIRIPNREVQEFFRDKFIEVFFGSSSKFENMMKSLKVNNISEFEKILGEIFESSLSFYDLKSEERIYHILILGMVLSLDKEYYVTSNRESGYGRYDLCLEPKNKASRGYIIEFKKANKEKELERKSKEGLYQIINKKYDTVLKEKGIKKITLMGMAFCVKKIKISFLSKDE